MHLANAVQVPVIALMRCTTPEWVPIDSDNSTVIMLAERDDWVTAIGVADVLAALDARPPASSGGGGFQLPDQGVQRHRPAEQVALHAGAPVG